MQKRSFLVALGSLVLRPANALYDPPPIAHLADAPGVWQGSLTYRDYQKPDRMVTLKAAMTVSLAAPDELALYYDFDDGPGKTVYSYERMKFDLSARQLLWISGTSKPQRSNYTITAATAQDGKCAVAFEKIEDTRTDKFLFELTSKHWSLTKLELPVGAPERLRSQYAFVKT